MKMICGPEALTYLSGRDRSCALTIGKFDGLHRGHRMLIENVVHEAAERGILSAVLSFEMTPEVLLTRTEKAELLEKAGVDLFLCVPFSASVIRMEAGAFVRQVILDGLHAAHVCMGEDFRFGYHRAGSAAFLSEEAEKYGFSVHVAPSLQEEGRKVGSSWIKELLKEARIEEVNHLLGYEYFLTGEVIHGRELGRTLGVPTANIVPEKEKLLPPFGVYFTRSLIGGRICPGITNIGCKPTVNGTFAGAETYLYDTSGDLYGEQQKISLLRFLRPEVRFPSVEALKEQLMKDVRAGEALMETAGF